MSSTSDPTQIRIAVDRDLARAEAANLREQLDRANTERQRLAEELAATGAEAERLRGVLRDILAHFTDWRAALDPAAQAGERRG